MAVRMDAIGMVVRDLEASLRFYRRLGIEIPEGQEGEDHVEATLACGCRLMWDKVELVRSFDPGWVEPVGQRIGLAFRCDSPAEVDAKYAELTGLGYPGHHEPWDAFWGQRYAVILDPDGNKVDLFAPL